MTARTLTIQPFKLPDGTVQNTDVQIRLVDANNVRIQGLVVADGQPIIDLIDVSMEGVSQDVDLFPQPDIEAVLNYGSDADQSLSYYLVRLRVTGTRYTHVFRTQVAAGGALTWAEFVSGAGELSGGQLSQWLTHINNDLIHLPNDAENGQVAIFNSTLSAWVAAPSGEGVSDHGLLSGLTDDDHTQYHTDARGDARYSLLAHTHVLADITDSGALAALDQALASHIDSGAATDGQVLTADGAGNAAWEDASGGGGAFSADAQTQITPATAIVLDEALGNEIALSIPYTVNKATSGDVVGLDIAITDTASPGTLDFLKLSKDGTTQLSIDEDGSIYGRGSGSGTTVWHLKNNQDNDCGLEISSNGASSGSIVARDAYGGYATLTQYREFRNVASGKITWSNNEVMGSADIGFARRSAGIIGVTAGTSGQGAFQLGELSSAPSGVSDAVILFAEDNGSGKTRLMAQFPTGAVQQIAIEP